MPHDVPFDIHETLKTRRRKRRKTEEIKPCFLVLLNWKWGRMYINTVVAFEGDRCRRTWPGVVEVRGSEESRVKASGPDLDV